MRGDVKLFIDRVTIEFSQKFETFKILVHFYGFLKSNFWDSPGKNQANGLPNHRLLSYCGDKILPNFSEIR